MVLLQELKKQLLGDDDYAEAEAEGSACGSMVTTSAWGNTMQELKSITAASLPSLPMASATSNNYSVPISRSPANSVSSATASAIADGDRATAAAHLAVMKMAEKLPGDAEERLVAAAHLLLPCLRAVADLRPPAPSPRARARSHCPGARGRHSGKRRRRRGRQRARRRSGLGAAGHGETTSIALQLALPEFMQEVQERGDVKSARKSLHLSCCPWFAAGDAGAQASASTRAMTACCCCYRGGCCRMPAATVN